MIGQLYRLHTPDPGSVPVFEIGSEMACLGSWGDQCCGLKESRGRMIMRFVFAGNVNGNGSTSS